MQTISPPQNRRLHQLLPQAGIDAIDKKALVKEFSNGRTESSRELLMNEAQLLIRHLEASLGLIATAPTAEQDEASDLMRRKILSLAHEMRWEIPATGKVDMGRVNGWCQARGFGKKVLNDYSHAELTKLLSQFKIMYSKYLKELSK